MRRAGQALHLELHQALGGKADHLAQEIGIDALLQKLAQGDAVVGHRGGPRSVVAGRNPTLPEILRWPPGTWPERTCSLLADRPPEGWEFRLSRKARHAARALHGRQIRPRP
jgi:hypothetical protein